MVTMSIILIILSQIDRGLDFLQLKKLILVISMQFREFIFSEKRSVRITRHLLFWIVIVLYFDWLSWTIFGTGVYNPNDSNDHNLFVTLSSILMLIPQWLIVYPLLYFVFPRYLLNNKYVLAFIWIIGLVVFSAFINQMIARHVHNQLLALVLPADYRFPDLNQYNFRLAIMNSSTGGVTSAVMAIGIKLTKYWYLKEQRNLQLQKENVEAQLQLLTAQVHPHFLFNTLNNIYSKAQTESPVSAKMIIGLSHILRFVLDAGKHTLVRLEAELQTLIDYINLEKMRYDDRLELHILMPSKTENLYIVPLLILPFVENSFKHGSSKMLQKPWINLKIEMKDTLLFMKLMNGKKSSHDQYDSRKGIGIENVRKRLDLLYKDRYTLQIKEDEEVFVVNLTVELVKIAAIQQYDSISDYAKG